MKKRILSALAMVLAFALVFTGMGKTTKASAKSYYDWYWDWFFGDYDYDYSKKTTFTVNYYSAAPEKAFIKSETYTGTWDKNYKWNQRGMNNGAYVAEIDLPTSYVGVPAGYTVAGWNFGTTWKGEGEFPTVNAEAEKNIVHGYANYKRPVFNCFAVLDGGNGAIPDDGRTDEQENEYKVIFMALDNELVEEGKTLKESEFTEGAYEIQLPSYDGQVDGDDREFAGWKYNDQVCTGSSITLNIEEADDNKSFVFTASFKDTETPNPGPDNGNNNNNNDNNNDNNNNNNDNNSSSNNSNNDYTPVVPAPVVPAPVEEEKEEEVVEDIVETEIPEAPVEEEVAEEEIEVVEEVEETIDTTVPETPEADASLPQTGVAPASLFFGMGAAIIALGGAMIIFGRRKQF